MSFNPTVSVCIMQMLGLKIKNMSNFHPLEVVGRGSETQLRVGKNLNKIGFCTIDLFDTLL